MTNTNPLPIDTPEGLESAFAPPMLVSADVEAPPVQEHLWAGGRSALTPPEVDGEASVSTVSGGSMQETALRHEASRPVDLMPMTSPRSRPAATLDPQALHLLSRLSAKERQILGRLMEGMTAQQIADEFYVALATVRGHIQAILQKLRVTSQLAAVVMAYKAGWTDDDQHQLEGE